MSQAEGTGCAKSLLCNSLWHFGKPREMGTGESGVAGSETVHAGLSLISRSLVLLWEEFYVLEWWEGRE